MPDSAIVPDHVNGVRAHADVEPRKTLADSLREDCGLTGTHLGCEHGVCGACTVLARRRRRAGLPVFAVQADGADVTTVEGLAPADGELSAVQQALHEAHGLQCGFCTPGFVVSITAFLRDNPDPDRRRRCATACPATSAAAPATRASSTPSSWPRPPDEPAVTAIRQTGRDAPAGRFVGQRVQRREDARLVTGHGTYVDDVVVPGMLHAAFAAQRHRARARSGRSTSPPRAPLPRRGRRVHRRRPQRRRRRDAGSTSRVRRGEPPFRVMAEGDVRFAGEPLALVVAESRYVAEDACRADRRRDRAVRRGHRGRGGARRRRPTRAPRARRSNVAGQIPAAPMTRARRDLRVGRARRHRDVRAAPLPLRADGDPRHRVAAGIRSAASSRCGSRRRAPRRARLPGARARRARAPHPRDHGRRRRRLRAEDVHAARRGRRRRSPASGSAAR